MQLSAYQLVRWRLAFGMGLRLATWWRPDGHKRISVAPLVWRWGFTSQYPMTTLPPDDDLPPALSPDMFSNSELLM